jgi:hypothetical protein
MVVFLTVDERKKIIEDNPNYEWETCVGCGRCEKEYFLKTGWAMLAWHVEEGMLCEFCYGDYPDDEEGC